MAATTSAVTLLRKATAVATLTPWSNASRAATWLAPIMNAMSNRVAKAARLRATGEWAEDVMPRLSVRPCLLSQLLAEQVGHVDPPGFVAVHEADGVGLVEQRR